MKFTGGKSVEGAHLGILMLDAQFPRIPGEVGNALTWDFPVHYKIVRGASPQRVVKERAAGLLQPFIDAGRELIAMGADGITTNCRFLSLFQAPDAGFGRMIPQQARRHRLFSELRCLAVGC